MSQCVKLEAKSIFWSITNHSDITRTVVIAIRCGQYGSQSEEFLCIRYSKGTIDPRLQKFTDSFMEKIQGIPIENCDK